MKKIIAVLAIAAAATSVFAESSVKFGGRAEIGAYNPITSDKSNTIDQVGNARTFLALEAKEDLGAGTTVGFYAQSRFKIANGNSSYGENIFEQTKLWIDTPYGKLSAGKYTTNLGSAIFWTSPLRDDGALASLATLAFPRQAGQVSYSTPRIAGFQFETVRAYNDQQVSSTNVVTPTPGGHNLTQNTLTYVNLPFRAYYGQTNNYAVAQQTNQQFGAVYDFGKFSLMAARSIDSDGIVSKLSGAKNDVLTSFGAQTTYQRFEFGIATLSSEQSDFQRNTVSANYVLSKRTKIVTQVAKSTGHTTKTSNGVGTYFALAHTF